MLRTKFLLCQQKVLPTGYLDDQFEISKSRIKGFLTQEDPSYDSYTSTLTLLGISYSDASNPPYFNYYGEDIGGHAASIHDPQFSEQRSCACLP